MLYGQYKSTHIFLFKDDEDKKWYARDLTTSKRTEKFDTIDQLRDALRLDKVTWTRNFSNIK